MTSQSLTQQIEALLLDIEGTTTPIDFVYNVLFPYSRRHLEDYLSTNPPASEIDGLIKENAQDVHCGLNPPLIDRTAEGPSLGSVAAYVNWLIDRDRKSTSLKSLQGKIWDEGYRKGELRSQVYEDVRRAFERWRKQSKEISIYSSGSVHAQKLLFANTEAGDLTPLISHYFDTNIGAKRDSSSYRRIADELKLEPSSLLFVSDITDELDAAEAAGFQTALCIRPGNHPQDPASKHARITSFDQILP